MTRRFIFLAGLAITVFIFITNYKPNTYLIGWDNLQTDLNPILGVKRALFGVWQEYQSFGLLSGLAHPADLVRAFFVMLLSWVMPGHFIRYLFHHIMILIGFLGVARFCHDFSSKGNKLSALFGGIFYIFNFGTIQILGLPWEAFAVFFAFLPWQMWIFLKILTSPTNYKRDFLLLFIINLLATPQAYIQTLFVSYFLILISFWLGLLLKNYSVNFYKKSLITFSIILGVNLFWILPQVYFLKTSSYVVTEAKANVLSTDDLKFINKDKGNLLSFIKLEGFYFEFRDFNQVFMFEAWKKHFQTFPFMFLPYLLIALAFFGFFFIPKHKLSFLFSWLIIAFALLSVVPPFSFLHDLINKNNFISQIFRSPFTKFIIPNVFLLSYFFSLAIGAIFEKIARSRKIHLGFCLSLLVIFLLAFFPVFQGNFFASQTRITIPKKYFQLFDFFKTQDKNKRIALLPDPTFWGWFIHNWGYNGSGFLWYNIEQPIVSRNFDVWSDKSEGYYWEMKTALEAEDPGILKKVFDKYAVDFLIYDKSILPIASSIKSIQYQRIDELLKITEGISLVKKWNYLSVYKISHKKQTKDFVWASSNLPNIGPMIKFTSLDNAFLEYGDYKTEESKPYNFFYPFLDLFTQNQKLSGDWKLDEVNSNWRLTKPLPLNLADFNEVLYPLTLNIQNNLLTVKFPKLIVSRFDLLSAEPINCGYGYEDIEKEINKGVLGLIAKKGAAACLSFKDNNLKQQYGYIVKIKSKNFLGQRMLFYILDSTKDQSFLEDRLRNDTEYYILPPKYQYGLGYEFNFRSNSYEKSPGNNVLEEFAVFFAPFNKLKEIKFTNTNFKPLNNETNVQFDVKKIFYYMYEAKVSTPNSYIILNQAFHSGWKAFQVKSLLPTELKEHILINNWANGWKVNSKGTVIIIFLPQLLEFLGFGILILTLFLSCPFFSHAGSKPPSSASI